MANIGPIPPSTPTSTGVAPISLADLARRAAALWSLEPYVPPERRTQLFADLNDLEQDIDTHMVRGAAGLTVHPRLVRECAERLLWLREQWGHDEAAA